MSVAVRDLQVSLNRFSKKYLRGTPRILVDGKTGHATRVRVELVKHYLGYQRPLNAVADAAFVRRMRHPTASGTSTPARIALGMRRRAKQRIDWRRNHHKAVVTSGVTHYDGVPVAAVAVPILQWCRDHGWHGRLVSGWRDPVYSRSLCFRMCGAASCPGRCAGLASNHVGSTRERFAIDVSDYVSFGQIVARCPIAPRLHNYLGSRDPVHWSPSGR